MELPPDKEQAFAELASEATEPLDVEQFDDEETAVDFVNWCLEGSYSDEGKKKWWSRPRPQLDGRSPAEAWEDDPKRVIGLAGWLVNRSLEDENQSS